MSFTNKEIVDIADELLIEDHTGESYLYDWIDVVGVTQRPDKLKRSLYFTTHSDGTDGWHNAFDRRPMAQNVAKDKGWHLAIEPETSVGNYAHMIVSSLIGLSERLYETSRLRSNPYVIGVTGSVGKTTTVAFLEHLIKESEIGVTRFWSKRLTPLLVQCHYINRVNNDTSFIVMEYSAYGKEHIEKLAKVLPPDIAFLTNIYEMHVGQDLFKNEREVFESKIRIKPDSAVGMVNSSVLEKFGLSALEGWASFNIDEALASNNPALPPTRRTAELYTVGKILADVIGISPNNFREAFSTFIPQERRILSCEYKGANIFFDGEATGASRLLSWFETIDGREPTLLVDNANSMLASKELLEKVFEAEGTFVLDTKENREHIPVRAKFVNAEEFGELLNTRKEDYLVYHKGLATRQIDFNPTEYLKIRWG